MTEQPRVRRVAEMRLRVPSGWLPLRVYWPRPADAVVGVRAPVLVDLPGGAGADERCRELCESTGSVVLCPCGPASVEAGLAVLGWAAEHATELDADPGRLQVTGDLADAVIAAAAADGWPPITRYRVIK